MNSREQQRHLLPLLHMFFFDFSFYFWHGGYIIRLIERVMVIFVLKMVLADICIYVYIYCN